MESKEGNKGRRGCFYILIILGALELAICGYNWFSDDTFTYLTIFKFIEPYLGFAFLAFMVLIIVYCWIKKD